MTSNLPTEPPEQALRRAEALYNSLRDILDKKNCVECEHWSTASQICERYQALPPAEVIVQGCPGFELKIPF